MQEQSLNLDGIFGSRADPTRRDILQRLMDRELTVSEIAALYRLSLSPPAFASETKTEFDANRTTGELTIARVFEAPRIYDEIKEPERIVYTDHFRDKDGNFDTSLPTRTLGNV